MTSKPPDLDTELDLPFCPPRSWAWNFLGPIPSSIPFLRNSIRVVTYGAAAFAISALLWGSPVRTPDFPYALRINVFIISTVMYLPRWGIVTFWASCGVAFGLAGLFVGDLWLHRRDLVAVTPPLPEIPAPAKEPSEPEEFYGRGTV